MSRALFAAFVLLADAGASHGEGAKTDLYGDPLPPGAVARLGTIRLRHARADVTFSADGKHLISCGCGDGEVRVWDAASGRLVRRTRLDGKPRKQQRFQNVVLSPSGRTAAAWDGKSVSLFDTTTGKERHQFPVDPGGNEPLLTFSPDGKTLAVQVRNGNGLDQELWDVIEGKKRQTLATPTWYNLSQVAFTPNGKYLAGIVRDGTVTDRIHLWDTTTGKEIRKAQASTPARCLAFSPDGKTLAAGSTSRDKVWLLDAVSLKEKIKLEQPADVGIGPRDRLAFSPDGQLLATTFRESRGQALLIWALDGSKKTRRLRGRFGSWFAFAPDGKTLASNGFDSSEIHLWDVATGRPLHQRPGHDHPVTTLTASPDGKVIASGDAGVVRLWDAATSRPLRLLESRGVWIDSCLFSPDGKRVISAGWGDAFPWRIVFQVWDGAAGKELRRFEIKGEPLGRSLHAAAISADGKRLAAVVSLGADNSTARLIVWDLATGRRVSQRPYKYEAVPVGGLAPSEAAYVAFAPDGERVGVWRGDRAGLEEVATGSLLATLPKGIGQRGRPLVFSPDGRLLAANAQTEEGTSLLSLIETASGEEVLHLTPEQCGAVTFTPDSRGVVVADGERLTVWDTDTGNKLYQLAMPEGVWDLSGVVALPGGRAATAMTEGDILVWDLAPASWPVRKPAGGLSREQLDALWSDLRSDARKARRAIYKLADAPVQAVAFLKDHLRPAAVDTKRIKKLLADLDGDSFAVREAASRELARRRYEAEPMLRQRLEGRPSLETRRRLESILAGPKRMPAEALRTLRSIAVLERISTPEARRILEKLAGGEAVHESQEAQAALERLKRH